MNTLKGLTPTEIVVALEAGVTLEVYREGTWLLVEHDTITLRTMRDRRNVYRRKDPPAYTLKPLKTLQEIVDTVLAGKTIMRRDDKAGAWWVEQYPRTNISIQGITTGYFAEQIPAPKPMFINGVEVPAPIKNGTWFVQFHLQAVCKSSNVKDRPYWATEEDAKAVLAAMLKPFKELTDE